MKATIVICVFGLMALTCAKPSEHYTDRYDDVDLDMIIQNRRLLVPYIMCALEKGKCTADGKELRSHIREALETDCEKCTEVQRNGTNKVIGHLINHEVDYWNQLKAKYDPQNKYATKHEQELRKLKA